MAKTVLLEELPPDTRRVFEELLSSEEPVILSRGGQPLGGMIAYHGGPTSEETPEEKADLLAAITQGEVDYKAGRYKTLDAFKKQYTARLQEDAE